VRWWINQEGGITIHDCFLIDHLNTTYLIAKINEGMRTIFYDLKLNENIHENMNEIFSIFILL
jgi:hypothetical protein